MSQIVAPITPLNDFVPAEDDERFAIGWRYVLRPGTEHEYDIIPLTEDDLLFPEEEDHVVHGPQHSEDLITITTALKCFYDTDPTVVVLSDCRVDFGVPGLRPLGGDITVFAEVPHWLRQGTFRVAQEGGVPWLVVEFTSPNTRNADLNRKPETYYPAGVLKYVILDRGWNGQSSATLRCFQRGETDWEPLLADAQGRIDLSPIPLWMVVEDDCPRLYDQRTGERLPNVREAVNEARDAKAKLLEEAQARVDAEAKAKDAQAKAKDAQAKAKVAQAKAKVAQAEANDAQAKAKDAEAKRLEEAQARVDAEAKARNVEAMRLKEAEARANAEAKAKDAEAKQREAELARAALEQRLKLLEEELRRP